MKLNFKRQYKLPIKEERKLKLESLEKRKKLIPIRFDYTLTPENQEEEKDRIKNFHLFCISIVQDLLEDKFKTNEEGSMKYSHNINAKNIKYTVRNLQKMFSTILNENKEK